MIEVGLTLAAIVLAWRVGRSEAKEGCEAAVRDEKRDTKPRVTVTQVTHANGNNCPSFAVRKDHAFPVLWCPFCGAEMRHAGTVTVSKDE